MGKGYLFQKLMHSITAFCSKNSSLDIWSTFSFFTTVFLEVPWNMLMKF